MRMHNLCSQTRISSSSKREKNVALLLLVEMVDQRGLDLQLEFMFLVVVVRLVMLQTGSRRKLKIRGSQPISVSYVTLFELFEEKQKQSVNLLCEKEEAVIRQAEESAARQDVFEQMVQLSEANHLFLQVHFRAQVIRLWGRK